MAHPASRGPLLMGNMSRTSGPTRRASYLDKPSECVHTVTHIGPRYSCLTVVLSKPCHLNGDEPEEFFVAYLHSSHARGDCNGAATTVYGVPPPCWSSAYLDTSPTNRDFPRPSGSESDDDRELF